MDVHHLKSNKDNFLELIKAARKERDKNKQTLNALIKIQSCFRRYLVKIRLRNEAINEMNIFLRDNNDNKGQKFISAIEGFKIFQKFLFVFNHEKDKHLFESLCKYIISSMFQNESQMNHKFKTDFVTVALEKKYTTNWMYMVKKILIQCLYYLKEIKPELVNNQSTMVLYLNVLINFTSCSTWTIFENKNEKNFEFLLTVMNRMCKNILNYLITNGFYQTLNEILMQTLCRNRILIKKPTMIAILTLSIRPLINSRNDEESIRLYILYILSVPALVHHVSVLAHDYISLFNTEFIKTSLFYLNQETFAKNIFNDLEGNYILIILANLIELCHNNISYFAKNDKLCKDFIFVVKLLLENCEKYLDKTQNRLNYWHPIFGWFSQTIDQRLGDSLVYVKKQLQLYWSPQIINLLFKHLLEMNFKENLKNENGLFIDNFSTCEETFYRNIFRKAASFITKNSFSSNSINNTAISNINNNLKKLITNDICYICLVCSTYILALKNLFQLKLEILTGLCYHEEILKKLWKTIWSFCDNNSINLFLDSLEINPKADSPEFQLLKLVCDCSTHLITILDDKEFYTEQKPFLITDLITISSFLNHFLFRIIYVKQIDINASPNIKQLFYSLHSLLILLYRRDSRREFVPKDHWIIKEIKINNFMKDLENKKNYAQLLINEMPHLIPHKERFILFRKLVNKNKEKIIQPDSLSSTSFYTLITVHRSRILEDGFQQLNKLSSNAFKNIIRVKFVNEQGLYEAGIDQDGVFKEFLEETMKKIFDPSLNLFSVTSEQRLYPSPTSNLHENHLSLFEYAGKMLGKAVYEGILIDAPFASFFLNQILNPYFGSQSNLNQPNLLYSSIDQLPSLDLELYKSLTYIKHYQDDVSEFNLTFSVNENRLGQLVTHELLPGGKLINVTKENKIAYIHLMAHFRMHKQIDEQCKSFVQGFLSIISANWLKIFSIPEIQRLISGDTISIDLADLRRNTKYYGGFHNNHRLINWLWDILQNDFSNEEISLFLKFVTSCSKPPLLGFAYLNPPFAIRCVETGEDLDDGDTVGSVIRGFFTITTNGRLGKGKKNDNAFRLPTSSTCFNLLKLPNYQKKSLLREKLKYAIKSNTGFELS